MNKIRKQFLVKKTIDLLKKKRNVFINFKLPKEIKEKYKNQITENLEFDGYQPTIKLFKK